MLIAWELWWCCLKPGWRDMFNWMGTLSPSPDVMAFRSVYDEYFEAYIAPKDCHLYPYFNQSFGVYFATIDIPILGETEMAIWELLNWVSFKGWQDEDGYLCVAPCPYTSGPFVLPP